MSNKLFSEPIISSNNDLDKDYTLDNNGNDLDPNKESLYDLNDETDETANTSVENKETTDNDIDIKDSDIFTTEPLSSQEVKRANQVTNNYAKKMDQTYNDTVNEYEDEPDTLSNSSRNWIIIGAIVLIILICGGWLVYSMFHKEDTTPKQEVTNVVVNPAPDTQKPNDQDQQTPPTDNSGSSSNQDYSSDDYYPEDNYNGSGGSSYSPGYNSGNDTYDNSSTDNSTGGNDSSSTDEAPPQDNTTEPTDDNTTPAEDQSTDSQTSTDTQTDTDSSTASSDGASTESTDTNLEPSTEAIQNSNPSMY